MPLSTIQEYITATRTLLQDEAVVTRYTDGELAEALGFALMEARRIRPELFIFSAGGVPNILRTTSVDTAVDLDEQYRVPMIYYIGSWVMRRDEEEGSQQLANSYYNSFVSKLLSVAA